jgi:uncharacterized membrane protein
MRYLSTAAVLCITVATAANGGKPGGGGSPPPNPQVAYETLGGSAYKLIVSDENGTNASTLYRSNSFFRFDLAPRSQRQIAMVDSTTTSMVRLLTYGQTGTGAFAATGTQTLAPARRGSNVDFSPDGTKLAYACDSNNVDSEHLCVYDLASGTVTVWGSDSYYWDLAWFRGGAAIAYSTEDSDGITRLREIDGPGATPQVIFTTKGDLYLDAARSDPDALVLSYHDEAGNALIGLWKDGNFIDPNLANLSVAFFGETNCTDTEVAFLGPPNTSPDWYIRDLTSGLTTTFSRTDYRWVQFWPTCS